MTRFFQNLCFLLLICLGYGVHAQEMVLPLQENAVIKKRSTQKNNVSNKPTALTLPFFEDFTDYDPYPNPARWEDKEVYINNTMGKGVVSRGVATFDALNAKGAIYYDTVDAFTTIYADSLTSLPFDLTTHQVADSVYLSFFCERRGYGFSPKLTDSLMLYFLTSSGVWKKVWSQEGDTAQLGFLQFMIPLNDTGYFYDNFKMRWVNKATLGVSNSHWNLDYIRMDANRTYTDTAVRDVAFSTNPAFILSDYTSMPFRHFKTNPATFLAPNLKAYIKNNGGNTVNVNVGYTAKDQSSGSSLGAGTTSSNINSYTEGTVTFPMYNAGTFNPANPNGKVVYEEQFYCNSQYPNESKVNDTVAIQQVFDNYFAYDDGTAEQSYFLNLLPNSPGITAVEYGLSQTDTIRGVAIRFARTQPDQAIKDFSLAVYSNIAVNGGNDQLVYKEDYFVPSYIDTINAFYIYTFSQPVILNSGVFFIGIIQPAGGVSDSLQIALDANRVGGNHRYYRVAMNWEPSLLDGALMVRPIVGAALPLGLSDTKKETISFHLYPNPTNQELHINTSIDLPASARYQIVDMIGKTYQEGQLKNKESINIDSLPAGMYFFRINDGIQLSGVQKFIKL